MHPFPKASTNDNFCRGRKENRADRRASSGSGMRGISELDGESSDGDLRTPSPPARTASEAHGDEAMLRRLAARFLAQIFPILLFC